jgi:hypothetical protein
MQLVSPYTQQIGSPQAQYSTYLSNSSNSLGNPASETQNYPAQEYQRTFQENINIPLMQQTMNAYPQYQQYQQQPVGTPAQSMYFCSPQPSNVSMSTQQDYMMNSRNISEAQFQTPLTSMSSLPAMQPTSPGLGPQLVPFVPIPRVDESVASPKRDYAELLMFDPTMNR